MHITFDYRIASSRVGKRAQLHCDLIELLRAVDKADSLAAAADALGVSYRHLWGQLRHWEETLGIALTERTRGSHTRLSEAGLRLLRSERLSLPAMRRFLKSSPTTSNRPTRTLCTPMRMSCA